LPIKASQKGQVTVQMEELVRGPMLCKPIATEHLSPSVPKIIPEIAIAPI
jgi:hypothetical protein